MNKIMLFCAPLMLGACTVTGGQGQHIQEWQSYGIGGAERVVVASGNAGNFTVGGEKITATAGKDGQLLLNGQSVHRSSISGTPKLPAPKVTLTENGLYKVENIEGLSHLFVWDKNELQQIALTTGEHRPEKVNSPSIRAQLNSRNFGNEGPVLVGVLKTAPAPAVAVVPHPQKHEIGSLLFFSPEPTVAKAPMKAEEQPVQENLLNFVRESTRTPAPVDVKGATVLTRGSYRPYISKTFVTLPVEKLQMLESVGLAANARNLQHGGPLVFVVGNQYPTGGYSLELTGATLEGQKAIVTVRVNSPAPDSMVTQALTTPWMLLELKGDLAKATSVEIRGLGTTKGVGEVLNDR